MIPDIPLSNQQIATLDATFASWASHFRVKLHTEGFSFLIKQYERVIRSAETQSCTHGPTGSLKTGSEWKQCCGLSYEYLDDISSRTAIEYVLDVLNEPDKQRFQQLVAPLDLRLQKLLDANSKVYREDEIKEEPRSKFWWNYKLPHTIDE